MKLIEYIVNWAENDPLRLAVIYIFIALFVSAAIAGIFYVLGVV